MRTLLLSVILVATFAACHNAPHEAVHAGTAAQDAGLPHGQVEVLLPAGPARFDVEVALDENARARGLMFREKLASDAGMLFIFEHTQMLSFWMKNTLIPLDMLFIDEAGRIVGIVEGAEPLTESSRRVDQASRYVLELPGGTCAARGITADMRVRFEGIPGHPVATPEAMR